MKMLPVEKIAKLMQDNDAEAIMEEMRNFREEESRKRMLKSLRRSSGTAAAF